MTEKIFLSQLKNLRRSIHADATQSGVFVCSMIDYLNTHSSEEQQRQEYYGMLLNELLCDEVVGDAQLCRQTLLPAINAYAAAMGRDDTDIWADVFERYLGAKTDCHHPLVFADILRICRSDFRAAAGQNVGLPLDDEFDLSELIRKWGELFERYLADGSSYLLMLNADARNDIAKYLLSAAESSGSVRVVFPYPGTGIEPLLILYTMSLIYEVKHGSPLDNVKFTLVGDKSGLLRSIDVSDNSFDEVFINLKKTFCEQNRLKVKDIKTTLKSVKHKMNIQSEWTQKTKAFAFILPDMFIIESRDGTIVPNCDTVKLITETFDRTSECAVQYLLCRVKKNAESAETADNKTESAKSDYISRLYAVRDTFSEKEMKKKLSSGDYIVSENQMIKYAELLLLAGQYGKSFDVIKQYYETDFDKSYQLLQNILGKCKNNKINEAIERFIVDKEMKPNGLGEAMLEAIVDGIEDYFDSNPDSVLKDKQWL